MLSLFPELLYLSPLAAFMIRLAVAGVFAYTAWRRISADTILLKAFAIVDGIVAVLLVAGGYTQAAALIGALCAAVWFFYAPFRPLPRSTIILVFIMCLSLLLTGPGAFAFDLPL